MKFFKGRNYSEELLGEGAFGGWSNVRAPTNAAYGGDRFHFCGFAKTAVNVGTGALLGFRNTLHVWPVIWEQGRVIEQVGVVVSTASAGGEEGVCGIYEHGGRSLFFPGRLLQATNNFLLDSVGAAVDANVNFRVPRTDIYWVSLNLDATAGNFRGIEGADYLIAPFGFNEAITNYTQPFLSGAQTFAVPPDRLTPDIVAIQTAGVGVSPCPVFSFR